MEKAWKVLTSPNPRVSAKGSPQVAIHYILAGSSAKFAGEFWESVQTKNRWVEVYKIWIPF